MPGGRKEAPVAEQLQKVMKQKKKLTFALIQNINPSFMPEKNLPTPTLSGVVGLVTAADWVPRFDLQPLPF